MFETLIVAQASGEVTLIMRQGFLSAEAGVLLGLSLLRRLLMGVRPRLELGYKFFILIKLCQLDSCSPGFFLNLCKFKLGVVEGLLSLHESLLQL